MARAEKEVNNGGGMYLIKNRSNKTKAHIWTGNDTACRMWSTNGLKHEIHSVNETTLGRQICAMCQINAKKAKA